jgi:hypothetical protein
VQRTWSGQIGCDAGTLAQAVACTLDSQRNDILRRCFDGGVGLKIKKKQGQSLVLKYRVIFNPFPAAANKRA